jgi:predicted amidophosphoribosyltransferase
VGEATFQLKYRGDWSQVKPLAQAVATQIYPMLKNVGFILPMPASKERDRQPVVEISRELGRLIGKPVFTNLLLKEANGKSLKDLNTKAEKTEAIGDSFSIVDRIDGEGPWNVLVVDDLHHTGATMEAACKVLRAYPKVKKNYVAALTWR